MRQLATSIQIVDSKDAITALRCTLYPRTFGHTYYIGFYTDLNMGLTLPVTSKYSAYIDILHLEMETKSLLPSRFIWYFRFPRDPQSDHTRPYRFKHFHFDWAGFFDAATPLINLLVSIFFVTHEPSLRCNGPFYLATILMSADNVLRED